MEKRIKNMFTVNARIFLLAAMVLLLAGCGQKDTESNVIVPLETLTAKETAMPSKEPLATKEEDHTGQAQSELTGEWIDEEKAESRPYAVMINNIKVASPQSGTSQASILYEALVEGGITRLMGIFEDFDADRIGSTRSARHYFVSFADEYDAIFVHYGQTKYATSKIEELGVDNLSGLSGIGSTVFYRDNSILAPHNAFASYEGITKGTSTLGYRTTRSENANGYTFNDDDTSISGQSATKVTLGFSNYTQPYFTYDKETGYYYRYQFGEEHVDKTTGEQLKFKNLIIQLVEEWDIDSNGYQTMDIEHATGTGYYITNGKAKKITWEKNESDKSRTYYDSDGNELTLNVGKTYIAVYPTDRVSELAFS